MRDRHLTSYVTYAEDAEKRMTGAGVARAVHELDTEEENILAALAWCAHAHDGVSLGLRMSAAVYRMWAIEGRFTLGRRMLEEALARDTTKRVSPERAKALARAAGFALTSSDYAAAETYLAESLTLARKMGDRKAEARALAGLGVATMYQSRFEDSVRYGEASLALYEQLGEMRGVAMAHHNTGLLEHMLGRPARALDHFTAALTLLTASGDTSTETLCRTALAASSLRLGDRAGALAELRKSSTLLEGLSSVREMVYVLGVLAELLQVTGQARDAARMLGASESMRANVGMTLLPWEQREQDLLADHLTAEIGADAVTLSKQSGTMLSLDQSLAEVKLLLDSVRLD